MSTLEPLLGKAEERRLLSKSDERRIGIAKAAWKLEDAMCARLVAQYPSDPEARQLHFKVARAEEQFSKALLIMLILTVLETPAWCRADFGFFEYVEPAVRCVIPGAKPGEVLLSTLPYIPPGWAMIVELILLVIIAQKLLLDRQIQLRFFKKLGINYKNVHVISFGLGMVALEVFDCLLYVLFRPSFRLSFISHTGYFCLLPQVQTLALCVLAVVGEFVSIAVFYGGTIVFFAWVAVVMFDDMEGMVFGVPVNKGFDSFRTTLNTMFIAGSTDDFVEVLLPTYTAHRASGFLWAFFLVIVHVLLLSLVLDTLVAAYTKYAENKEEEDCAEMVNGIKEAFQGVQEATEATEVMRKEVFVEFCGELSKSPGLRDINAKSAELVFAAVDKDSSGTVNEREFFSTCTLIRNQFWITPEDSPVKEFFPNLWNNGTFTRFRGYVTTGGFDSFMNWVLVVNFVSVVIETVYDLNKWDEPGFMDSLELLFSLVYVWEVLAKLSVWHFRYYWAFRSNQFDFVVTWMLLVSSSLDILAQSDDNNNIRKYINILRLLRLVRVVKQLKRLKKVQLMVETIGAIVQASKHIMMLLGVVTFFFSTLSIQLWGGILYKSNPHLEETAYAEKELYVLNFNDFGTAFGTWVVLILREYMDAFSEAIDKTSGIPFSWLVFLLFYVAGVSIVFELVKAFTIEAFLELHKHWGQKKKENPAIRILQQTYAKQGLQLHYRESSGDTRLKEKIEEAVKEHYGEGSDSEEESEDEGHGHHQEPGGHH